MSSRTTTSRADRPRAGRGRRTPRRRCRRSTPRATAQYRPNAKYVLMLGLMCALPAISTDIYLPSLPDVARDLNTSATAAQLTMTAMLIGGAVGPARDRAAVGPVRPPQAGARSGSSLHVVTSLLCAVAPAIVPLIALRTVQGFFNASATRRGDGDHPRPVRRRGRLAADVPAHARHRGRAAVRPVARRRHRRAVGLARRCSSRSRCSAPCSWVVVWRRLPGDAAAGAAPAGWPAHRAVRLPRAAPGPALRRARHPARPRHGRADELRRRVAVRAPRGVRAVGRPVLAALRRQRRRAGRWAPR